ncbi:MAG: hypothetical protein Q9166_005760 [cf. Caloplaca sp. 2 TL-2023]
MKSDMTDFQSSPSTVKGDSAPAPLPPSVEAAYRKKCIQLKKRLNEVQDENDGKRLRIERSKRFIDKMRLERAILLERLGQIQEKKGLHPQGLPSFDMPDGDPYSEGSSEGPPTPNEKPLRSKRSHRRPMPSPPPGPSPVYRGPTQQTQPYPMIEMGEDDRNTKYPRLNLANFDLDFNPDDYQPPRVTYNPRIHLPGSFREHNPEPLKEFHTWFRHNTLTNPDFQEMNDAERITKSQQAYERLFSRDEQNHMVQLYQERLEDWFRRRAEWEEAEKREMPREMPREAGNRNRNGERDIEEEEKEGGLKQEGDEEMGGAKGGFTAVNG